MQQHEHAEISERHITSLTFKLYVNLEVIFFLQWPLPGGQIHGLQATLCLVSSVISKKQARSNMSATN